MALDWLGNPENQEVIVDFDAKITKRVLGKREDR